MIILSGIFLLDKSWEKNMSIIEMIKVVMVLKYTSNFASGIFLPDKS